jgi:PBSX family phage terminase large subunit
MEDVKNIVVFKETDHYIQFKNGSEIWIDGLDDKERVEKFLGREYCTLFFNEASQISYDSYTLCQTRLRQNVKGCRNRSFVDCNPSGKRHWTNRLFILKQDPTTEKPVRNPDNYNCLQMNPVDNRENLPAGYIESTLENLPEAKRKRFLEGLFTDQEGVIFNNWTIVDEIPAVVKAKARKLHGLDFGYSNDPTCFVDVYAISDELWLDERIYQTGLRNIDILNEFKAIGINSGSQITADSSDPKSIDDLNIEGHLNINGAIKGQDSIRNGIDRIQAKKVFITRRSVNGILEAENYCWKPSVNGGFLSEPIDDYNHFWDSVRYGIEPLYSKGPQEIKPVYGMRR